MSYIIALTGGICSGKTTIVRCFSKFPKVSIIDADLIARKITQPKSLALSSIIKYFGPNILLSDGTLNRLALKRRIFFNATDKNWLEQLLHPIIKKTTQKEINKLYSTSSYIIWVVPLLIENNLQKYAHRTLVIDVHPDIQIRRIINRDKINKQYVKKILSSQVTRQYRLMHAHDVFYNNYDNIYDIESKILVLHQFYIHESNN